MTLVRKVFAVFLLAGLEHRHSPKIKYSGTSRYKFNLFRDGVRKMNYSSNSGISNLALWAII